MSVSKVQWSWDQRCYPQWPTLCSSLEGIEASSESSSDELTNVSLSPPERQNIREEDQAIISKIAHVLHVKRFVKTLDAILKACLSADKSQELFSKKHFFSLLLTIIQQANPIEIKLCFSSESQETESYRENAIYLTQYKIQFRIK